MNGGETPTFLRVNLIKEIVWAGVALLPRPHNLEVGGSAALSRLPLLTSLVERKTGKS